jgi:hypothetical protein
MANKVVTLDGEFAGWQCELRPQVSARILLELESGVPSRALAAFAQIIVSHNFKGINGEAITDVMDAPIEALTATIEKWAQGNSLDPK